jgi:hypothetical protein
MKILKIYDDYLGAKEKIKSHVGTQRSRTSPLLSHLSAKSMVFEHTSSPKMRNRFIYNVFPFPVGLLMSQPCYRHYLPSEWSHLTYLSVCRTLHLSLMNCASLLSRRTHHEPQTNVSALPGWDVNEEGGPLVWKGCHPKDSSWTSRNPRVSGDSREEWICSGFRYKGFKRYYHPGLSFDYRSQVLAGEFVSNCHSSLPFTGDKRTPWTLRMKNHMCGWCWVSWVESWNWGDFLRSSLWFPCRYPPQTYPLGEARCFEHMGYACNHRVFLWGEPRGPVVPS